jgi:hypothetical protein
MTEDYLRYCDLEKYLFEDVRLRFHAEGKLDAFDLLSIIIWKANRSKSRLAQRLMRLVSDGSLETAASQFTTALFTAESPEKRLLLAMKDWGFRLPMASAILTVLWPEEFTVYDVRVCGELAGANLENFKRLVNLAPGRVWTKYCEYREAVRRSVTEPLTLRDKDRFLWGRSAAKQLIEDISKGFAKTGGQADEGAA